MFTIIIYKVSVCTLAGRNDGAGEYGVDTRNDDAVRQALASAGSGGGRSRYGGSYI